MQKLLDLLGPVPAGMDIAADAVFGLKLKVIAGDPEGFYADLQALEQADGEMEQHASDVETPTG